MARRIITAILSFALRVFFRRVEVAGVEHVPRRGACVFVLNHPNGLIDPCFLFCFAPRRISFLAKSPLFRMPVIGSLCRAMEAIPVYRHQDEGENVERNRETFERAHALLARGGTLGICPEGTSHSEPSLRPLKTGAARIALGAASTGDWLDLKIVPAGLYYTAKTTFRSGALLYFGAPIAVGAVSLEPNGEPPRKAVRELSERIAAALREVTLNAEHHEALQVVARAERIFSAEEEEEEGKSSLERELQRRRRFVEGYATLRARLPERLDALEARIRRYEEELRQAGLEDPRDLSPSNVSRHAELRHLVLRALVFALLLPLALAGLVINYPPYALAGYLGTKFSHNYEDILSTVKIIAAMLLFPLTWAVWVVVLYALAGWRFALAASLAAPALGYVALRFSEEFDRTVAGWRALLFFITERRFFRQLLAERKAIRREILALGDEATLK